MLTKGSSKMCKHFHIPLQSGSGKILKLMKRRYDPELFRERIRKIRESMPLACIASDVIVGFPGETDKEFKETYDFINGLELSYLHVFSYSKRENTLAASMPEPVKDKVKKERSEILHKLSEEKKWKFYLQNKDRLIQVLFEADKSNGFMHGFTENYIKVKTPFTHSLVNQIIHVKLEKLDEDMTYFFERNPIL